MSEANSPPSADWEGAEADHVEHALPFEPVPDSADAWLSSFPTAGPAA